MKQRDKWASLRRFRSCWFAERFENVNVFRRATYLVWAYADVIAIVESCIDSQRSDRPEDNIACGTSVERRLW